MAYSALIARDTIAGRSLVAVIAIMSFLASLALGFVFLMNQASAQWTQSIQQDITIQLRPLSGRDMQNDINKIVEKLKTLSEFSAVKEISQKESEKMLEPWLGSRLDLSELPIPRLIIAHIQNPAQINFTSLEKILIQIAPNASLDDHQHWNERLTLMALTMVFAALIVFLLVMSAMILAVSFVTHGTMAENSEIINVLHYVGAENIYIAREFQTHFLALGLRGGMIGGGLAMLLFIILDRSFLFWAHGPEGDQLTAFFGQPSLSFMGYSAIVCVTILAGVLTALVSRIIVMRHLNQLW